MPNIGYSLYLLVVGEFSVLFVYVLFFILFLLIFGYDNLVLLPILILVSMLDLYGFMWVEVIVFPLYFMLVNSGSSFERIGSWYYLFFYGIVIGFLLLNSLVGIYFTLVTLLVVFSKYPVAGLHFWLPKVHVEASLIGSIVLAGLILKVSFILSWSLISCVLYVILVLSFLTIVIVLGFDGKVLIAYSSVVHISVGCIIFLFVSLVGTYCSLAHVIVSPLIFFICYFSYSLSGSRSVKSLLGGYIVLLVFLINMSFPPFGAFVSEVWLVSLVSGIMFIGFFLCYYFFVLLLFVSLFGASQINVILYLVPLVLLPLWIV